MFEIAGEAGVGFLYQDLVMKHPFYSKGVCIPSDDLYSSILWMKKPETRTDSSFSARSQMPTISLTTFVKVPKTVKRFAVNGEQRIALNISHIL